MSVDILSKKEHEMITNKVKISTEMILWRNAADMKNERGGQSSIKPRRRIKIFYCGVSRRAFMQQTAAWWPLIKER